MCYSGTFNVHLGKVVELEFKNKKKVLLLLHRSSFLSGSSRVSVSVSTLQLLLHGAEREDRRGGKGGNDTTSWEKREVGG